MKKLLLIMLAVMVVLALAACGEKQNNEEQAQNNVVESPAQNNNENTSPATQPATSEGSKSAKDGTITLNKADIAVVVNGTPVPMPFKLPQLEAAGVPADDTRSEIKLGAGDIFSANLSLDDNGDYLLIPAYQNLGDSEINITEAEAEEITMTSYADEPVDQGVSILGVTFGMARKDVKALLGEPSSDSGSYLEWHLEIPEMAYAGTLSLYVTEDADDAGVSQVNMVVFEK